MQMETLLWPYTGSPAQLACYGAALALGALLAGFLLGLLVARSRAVRRIARLEAQLHASAEAFGMLSRHYEETKADLRNHFQALASDVLDRTSLALGDRNDARLATLLSPLGERLRALNEAIKATNASGAGHTAALKEMIRLLMERAEAIGHDAANLTRALKGDPKVQGDWGETILEGMLEASGLVRGEQFVVQPSYDMGDGTRLRPDVVVRFPGNRSIVIDSKVSLTAYAEMTAASNDAARQAALKRHLASVRAHIKELSAKHYERLERGSLDYVLLFIPNESAYIAAMRSAPALATEAMENKVLLLSPANLVMALQLARFLWQGDARQRNVQAIADQATRLYEKFAHVQQSFDEMGKALRQAADAYDKARRQLCSGKGNYVSQLEKLRSYGISPAQSLREDP